MALIQQLKKGYNKTFFVKDLLAALSVVIILIPQGIAYGLLAGFPAEAGLYTGIVALFVYPLFASSRYLSVGPVALASIILLSGLSNIAEPGTTEYIQLGVLVCLISGIIQLILGALRLGILINFLSNPVINGFISASAIVIIINQLNILFGVQIERTNNPFIDLKNILFNMTSLNVISTIIGLSSIAVIFICKKFIKKIPSALIVFILACIATYVLINLGISVVKVDAFPAGFPLPSLPHFAWEHLTMILSTSILIAMISFVDSSVLSKSMATQCQNHRINPNNELFGLGMSKIIGSFFMNFPSSGSFARSEVNRVSGSYSQFSSILAAIIMLIVVLFLSPIFGFIPKAVLAAIIISSVIKLVKIREMVRIFKLDKADFIAMMGCFFVTILISIHAGIISGIIISIAFILWKAMRPHFAVLGRLNKENVYKNIDRFEEAEYDKSILIFRFDDDLYFANSDYFYEKIDEEVEERVGIKTVIIDFSSVSYIDTTGFDTLKLLSKTLSTREIELKFANQIGPVRDLFDQNGYDEIIDKSNCFMSIDLAVESCQ